MLDKPSRLEELEGVIERGIMTFVEVGNAIREIRDGKLYKDSHETFEAYCRDRWGWNRNYANKQVRAADTAALLGTDVPIPNEAVAREFAPLRGDPDTMNRVWGGVVEEYGETPASKHVKKAVQQALTAERIRVQLPDAARTIVEGIDPDNCNLPNDPKQLTHLLDVSHKHGDERAADTAERVGNGEFRSTFEAYPEAKSEKFKELAEKNPALTPEQKAPQQIGTSLRAWEKLDFDAVAKTTHTASAAESLGYDADRLMAVGKLLKEASVKRQRELTPGRLEAMK